jgi:hypothetical protein
MIQQRFHGWKFVDELKRQGACNAVDGAQCSCVRSQHQRTDQLREDFDLIEQT